MSVAQSVRSIPVRTSRSLLISLSHRRSLARVAMRTPFTRPVVARFVAGETLEAGIAAIERLRGAGLASTVDVLGESVSSPEQALAAVDAYVATIAALAERGLDRNVSLKLTQMGLDIDRDLCRTNLFRVLDAARDAGAFVRIDMEDHTRTDATLELWQAAHERHAQTGIVIQAALRRSADDIERVVALGGRIRLCKGAYDEPASVAFATKGEVDANYARLMERLLHGADYPALATHDPRLIARAIDVVEREGIGRDRFEFQMLYGVGRDLQRTLAGRGYAVRVYVPYGREWYPYFMRRLAERPANVAFLLGSLLDEEIRRLRRRQVRGR